MARYRKIDSRVWNDERFCSFSDHGKLVFLFLLTHPGMTALGAMRASLPGLAAELGWTEKAFREAFQEPLSKGLVKVDEKSSCILVKNFLKYNQPESPNVVKAWSSSLDLVPECPLKNEMIRIVKGFAEALPQAFQEALPQAFRKSMANPEPEPEPEPEQKEDSSGGESPLTRRPGVQSSVIPLKGEWPSVEKLVQLYNDSTPSELPAVRRLSPKRIEKARKALRIFPDRPFWEETFAQIHQSLFLRGLKNQDGRKWVADFDWLLATGKDGTENAVKTFEGKYP